MQYDPYSQEFTIDPVGHGKTSLDMLATTASNYPLRNDNANTPPASNSPETVNVIYEQLYVTDDSVNYGDVTPSTSNQPAYFTAGGVVGVPGPVYAFGAGGVDIIGDPDLIGSGFFNRITTLRKQPFFGFIRPGLVGAIERVVWHTTPDHCTTVIYYAPRPYRAWNNFDQSAHLGIFSRIDPFGRGQYRLTPFRAIAFYVTSASDTVGKYGAKSIQPGTGSGSTYGLQATSEDLILWNGAETSGIAGVNNLLADPNTDTFDVLGHGVVVGIDTDTGKRVVVTWMGYAACVEGTSGSIQGGSP